jgi:hypothetical protein
MEYYLPIKGNEVLDEPWERCVKWKEPATQMRKFVVGELPELELGFFSWPDLILYIVWYIYYVYVLCLKPSEKNRQMIKELKQVKRREAGLKADGRCIGSGSCFARVGPQMRQL